MSTSMPKPSRLLYSGLSRGPVAAQDYAPQMTYNDDAELRRPNPDFVQLINWR